MVGSRDAFTSQGMTRIAFQHQKLGEGRGIEPSLETSEGMWPCRHLNFGLLASSWETISVV